MNKIRGHDRRRSEFMVYLIEEKATEGKK